MLSWFRSRGEQSSSPYVGQRRGRKWQAALWLDGLHELGMIPVGRSWSCVRSRNALIRVSQQGAGLVADSEKYAIYGEIGLLLSKAVAIL